MAECRVEKFTLKELSAALTKGYIGKTKQAELTRMNEFEEDEVDD